MFRNKENEQSNNKSAFIMAGLVILLCLVSLTGATLALFTSNPDDGKIGVIATSGNVKVDIVDAEDEDKSLIGEVLQFETNGNGDTVLFEPGATFYTKGFKAKNVGNVIIKFRMFLSEDENLDIDEFEKAFDFYITDDPNSLKAAEELKDFSTELKVGECSKTYYLVIKMKEDATNEFQGKEYSGIGVTVCAVQGNAGKGE